MNETELYPEVARWLKIYLKDRHPNSSVSAYDTHRINLSKLILEKNLQKFFPQFSAFDIKVDITGIIISRKAVLMAFVECKIKPISLKDVGQILGYSRVAKPRYSFIVSPEGLSAPLNSLICSFGMHDILDYGDGLRIKLATWNIVRREIDSDSLVPRGEYI